MKFVFLYVAFAYLATAANLCAQEIAVRSWSGQVDAYAITASMIFGTGAGLLTKYILDKRYIFSFKAKNLAHESGTFALYMLMGLLTTAFFWAFEFGFHVIFKNSSMRYVGAFIGLSIGYAVKYQLDKRFVFNKNK